MQYKETSVASPLLQYRATISVGALPVNQLLQYYQKPNGDKLCAIECMFQQIV